MGTAMTVRLPEEKHRRLKELAIRRHTTINRLIDEMATMLLAENDAETRFMLRVQSGKGKRARGLELLDKAKGEEEEASRQTRVTVDPRKGPKR